MAHILTDTECEELLEYLKHHEPYDENDPIVHQFDGERDDDRMMATIAKKILETQGRQA